MIDEKFLSDIRRKTLKTIPNVIADETVLSLEGISEKKYSGSLMFGAKSRQSTSVEKKYLSAFFPSSDQRPLNFCFIRIHEKASSFLKASLQT